MLSITRVAATLIAFLPYLGNADTIRAQPQKEGRTSREATHATPWNNIRAFVYRDGNDRPSVCDSLSSSRKLLKGGIKNLPDAINLGVLGELCHERLSAQETEQANLRLQTSLDEYALLSIGKFEMSEVLSHAKFALAWDQQLKIKGRLHDLPARAALLSGAAVASKRLKDETLAENVAESLHRLLTSCEAQIALTTSNESIEPLSMMYFAIEAFERLISTHPEGKTTRSIAHLISSYKTWLEANVQELEYMDMTSKLILSASNIWLQRMDTSSGTSSDSVPWSLCVINDDRSSTIWTSTMGGTKIEIKGGGVGSLYLSGGLNDSKSLFLQKLSPSGEEVTTKGMRQSPIGLGVSDLMSFGTKLTKGHYAISTRGDDNNGQVAEFVVLNDVEQNGQNSQTKRIVHQYPGKEPQASSTIAIPFTFLMSAGPLGVWGLLLRANYRRHNISVQKAWERLKHGMVIHGSFILLVTTVTVSVVRYWTSWKLFYLARTFGILCGPIAISGFVVNRFLSSSAV